jgi:hypothetical protein
MLSRLFGGRRKTFGSQIPILPVNFIIPAFALVPFCTQIPSETRTSDGNRGRPQFGPPRMILLRAQVPELIERSSLLPMNSGSSLREGPASPRACIKEGMNVIGSVGQKSALLSDRAVYPTRRFFFRASHACRRTGLHACSQLFSLMRSLAGRLTAAAIKEGFQVDGPGTLRPSARPTSTLTCLAPLR